MYTCDICGHDVAIPENLCRVWYEKGDHQHAILVCIDCADEDYDTAEGYFTDAEGDPTWDYGKVRNLFRLP